MSQTFNEYGTPVTVLNCTACGREVTICPALDTPEQTEAWGTKCLSENCPSYDLSRDVDIFFESAFEAGLIVRDETDAGATQKGDDRG